MILYARDIDRLAQIRRHIDENLDKDLSLDIVCKIFNISSATLRRHFTFYFEKTFHNYILELRLFKASELLYSRSNTISEVCVLVGYKERSSFTRAFTKFFGVAPFAYIKAGQAEIAAALSGTIEQERQLSEQEGHKIEQKGLRACRRPKLSLHHERQ